MIIAALLSIFVCFSIMFVGYRIRNGKERARARRNEETRQEGRRDRKGKAQERKGEEEEGDGKWSMSRKEA